MKIVGIVFGYGCGFNNENIGKVVFVMKQYGGFEMDGKKCVFVGKNVYQFFNWENGNYIFDVVGSVIKVVGEYLIVVMQIYYMVMV